MVGSVVLVDAFCESMIVRDGVELRRNNKQGEKWSVEEPGADQIAVKFREPKDFVR